MMQRSQKTTLKKQVEEVTFKNPQFEDSQKKNAMGYGKQHSKPS